MMLMKLPPNDAKYLLKVVVWVIVGQILHNDRAGLQINE